MLKNRNRFYLTHMFIVLIISILAIDLTSDITAQVVSDTRILLLYSDGSVQTYNVGSGQFGERFGLNFVGVVFSPTSGRAYGLQYSTANVGFIMLGQAKIVTFDVDSGTTSIIYERNNIINFSVLPNEQIIVFYLSDDIQHQSDLRNFPPTFFCILSIELGTCRDVVLPEGRYGLVWANTDRILVIGGSEQSWYFIDLETLDVEPFIPNVRINDVADVGLENRLFVSISQESSSDAIFGYINIHNGEFTPYNFSEGIQFLREGVFDLLPSPSGQYMLFRSGASYYVLEMESGDVIGELNDLQNPHWLFDDEIIARYFATHGYFPQEIVVYDIESETVTTLESFDDEVFINIIPSP